MPQLPITAVGDAADVVLPAAVLEALGVQIGDALDVTVGHRLLILRPADDPKRRERLEEITRQVLERRRDAYRRLA